jgi:MFS-type transporter involved in bile tolerance (Atg22 family)
MSEEAGFEGRRGTTMLLLNLMLVTVFLILLAISVGEVVDAHHARKQLAGQNRPQS